MALSEFSAVLDRLTVICATVNDETKHAAHSLRPQFPVAFEGAAAVWDSAGDEERAGICRQLAELGGVLAGAAPAFVDLSGIDDFRKEGFWPYFALVLEAISSCSRLGAAGAWASSGSDLFRWARCATVFLTSGRKLVANLMSAGRNPQLQSPLERETKAASKLDAARILAHLQLTAMYDLLRLLERSAPSHQRTLDTWAAAVASPAELARWLVAMATVIHAAVGAGMPSRGALFKCTSVSDILFNSSDFRRHQAVLQAAPQQQALAGLLLPMASEILKAAQQCGSSVAGSSTSDSNSRARSADEVALVIIEFNGMLTAPCLQQGVQAQLQGSRGAQLVEAVAALLDAASVLPAAGDIAGKDVECEAQVAVACAWGHLCGLVHQDSPLSRHAARQAAQLLPALARMGGRLL